MWHRVGLSPLVFASAGSDRQSSVVALLFSDGFYQAGSANHTTKNFIATAACGGWANYYRSLYQK